MPIPNDDPSRTLTVAKPLEDDSLPHLAIAGGIYTILLSGQETAGRFTLIEMLVPPGGGPPPHRHDFDETFSVLEGAIEVTFRDQKITLAAGQAANIPANAPHSFVNVSKGTARLHCTTAPAGQDEFFKAVGDAVPSRNSPPPKLSAAEKAERGTKAERLADQYKTEFLPQK